MPNNPKRNEEKMINALNALKDLAPTKKFGRSGADEFETQVNKSLAPRRKLKELANDTIEQQDLRDTEDLNTLRMLEQIVRYVIADEEFGPDSALFEALGYTRKSERKTGLTRKRKTEENAMP